MRDAVTAFHRHAMLLLSAFHARLPLMRFACHIARFRPIAYAFFSRRQPVHAHVCSRYFQRWRQKRCFDADALICCCYYARVRSDAHARYA